MARQVLLLAFAVLLAMASPDAPVAAARVMVAVAVIFAYFAGKQRSRLHTVSSAEMAKLKAQNKLIKGDWYAIVDSSAQAPNSTRGTGDAEKMKGASA